MFANIKSDHRYVLEKLDLVIKFTKSKVPPIKEERHNINSQGTKTDRHANKPEMESETNIKIMWEIITGSINQAAKEL